MKHTLFPALALAIALAASLSLVLGFLGDDLTFIDIGGRKCGLEGTAISAAMKSLDRDKNRFTQPTDKDIDSSVSLPAMLVPGTDTKRFDQTKAARIRGIVVKVLSGGKETCNCQAEDKTFYDTHIELGLAADVPEIQRVIVEVTPRMRILFKKQKEWSTDALRASLQGKWVEVTGWLLFDTPHVRQAENTHPGNKTNFRATCWEIHPVTSIVVLDQAPAETKGFQPSSFSALQAMHATHVTSTAGGKKAIADLHKTLLSNFHETELAEADDEAKQRQAK
jgi:hypothetical protein